MNDCATWNQLLALVVGYNIGKGVCWFVARVYRSYQTGLVDR